MSDATSAPTTPELGAPPPAVVANGAAGAQVPAPAVKADVAAVAAPVVDEAAKKIADEAKAKADGEAKVAAEKKSADESKAALDKSWGDYKFKAPEGAKRDEAQVKQLSELARAEGLKPETAQKFLDLYDGVRGAEQKAADEALKAETESWDKSWAGDKDFGGEKTEATNKAANKAFEKYADADTLKFLKSTGLHKYPGLVKAFARIGAALKDDSIAGAAESAGAGAADEQRALQTLYPTMFKKA